MMADAQVVDSQLDRPRLDLLFAQQTQKGNLQFEGFLQLLIRVAQAKIIGEEPKVALEALMGEYLLPLHDKIIHQTQIGQDLQQFGRQVDSSCLGVLKEQEPVLLKMYEAYFPLETVRQPAEKVAVGRQSEQKILSFVMDMEIVPVVITQSQALLLFNHLLHNRTPQQGPLEALFPPLGVVFTLQKFLNFLLLLAVLHPLSSDQALSDLERLYSLLQRLEMSDGYARMWNKVNSKGSIKKSFIYGEQSVMSGEVSTSRHPAPVLEQYKDMLKAVFSSYCAIGESLNTERLGIGNYLKMMRDAHVLEGRSCPGETPLLERSSEVELIYKKVTPGGARMDFQQFLFSLQELAQKVRGLCERDSQVMFIVEQKIGPLARRGRRETDSSLIHQLMEVVQDPQVVQCLAGLFKSLLHYFRLYTDTPLMNFTQFLQFHKDFQVFPDLISKQKLLRIYNALCEIHQQNSPGEGSGINANLFVEGLSLIAVQLPQLVQQDNLTLIHKILYLAERMNHGPGAETAARHSPNNSHHSWDLLFHLREPFAQYLADLQLSPKQATLDFDQLLL